MIYIIEKMIIHGEHAVFNTAMIKVLNLSFPNQKKVFYGDKRHIQIIESSFRDEINNGEIEFIPNKIIDTSVARNKITKTLAFICRILRDSLLYIRIFMKISPKKGEFIFVTHIHPVSLFFLKNIKRFFPRKRLIIVLHGETDFIFDVNRNETSNIVTRKIYKKVFLQKQPECFYIVLSEFGKKKLVENNYLNDNEIIVLHHPYDYKYCTIKNTALFKNNQLTIGYIGSLTSLKKGNEFIEIITQFSSQYEQEIKISFEIIGRVEEKLLHKLNPDFVKFEKQKILLSREKFENKLSHIDYAIFLFTDEQYMVRVSGAFYDAMEFEKPIIALRSGYFENVFEEAGDIGFLCNDINEIILLISNVSKKTDYISEKYLKQVDNIKAYKRKLSLRNIGDSLNKKLTEINNRANFN